MASDLTGDGAAEIARPDVSTVDRPALPTPPSAQPHRSRFLAIYAILNN